MKKAVSVIVGAIIGTLVGALGMNYLKEKKVLNKEEKINKFKGYYNILNQWIMLKQEGKSLKTYFEKHNYKTIAIYGMGEMGTRLYDELKNTEIEIKYAIDKNTLSSVAEIEIVEIEDDLEEVDVIVVSATFAFMEIEEELKKKVDCPIVSLEDVVFES